MIRCDGEKIMLAKRSLELLLLLVLSTVPAIASARVSSNIASPASAQQFSEPEWIAILQEIKVFANAQISVRDAIVAEKRAKGAKTVDVSFDGRGEQLAYRVKAYRHGQVWQGTVDASTGEIGEEIERPVSMLDAKDKVELAGFRTAAIDLSEVVPIAEKCGEGKAVSAGLEVENGRGAEERSDAQCVRGIAGHGQRRPLP